MKKKNFCGLISLFVLILSTPFAISAEQPPLPPEISLAVYGDFYTEDTALIVDQIVNDASLCGIKLNVQIIDYDEFVYIITSGDFEMLMFVSVVTDNPDSLDTMISLLEFYVGDSNLWGYYNPEIKTKINEMELLYLDGFYDEAIAVFHEIELLMYEGQYYPAMGYQFTDFGVRTHLIIFNNQQDCFDIGVRNALSFLIDREYYITQIQTLYSYTVFQTSHLFGWSQYHDTSLPDIPHSISKAKSTLAHAGYRPCRIK